ncbi:MAG: class I SAM-dependent methyltransferase [Pseudomonadota bacterium]
MKTVTSKDDIPFDILRELHGEAERAKRRIKGLKPYVPKGGVGVEIGVFLGHFSKLALKHFKPVEFHLVDPWDKLYPENYPNWGAYTFFGRLPAKVAREFSEEFAQNEADCVRIFHGYSYEFYETIPDRSLDWIYIDGNHRYENVIRDLRGAFPKMKPDGVVIGDDYWENGSEKGHGVNLALDELLPEIEYKLVLAGESQFVLLPEKISDESVKNGVTK